MAERAESLVHAWLAELEACVRAEAYGRCRAIFADDVVAFGTRGARLVGLDALERDQWRRVWGTIRNFTFLTDDLAWGAAGGLIWLACPWTSEGIGPDGRTYNRPGRMTAILALRNESWVAVHTHHSLNPV